MPRSFIRGVLAPPLYGEQLTPAQWRASTKMRIGFMLVAIACDIALVVALPSSEMLDVDVLRGFAAINIPLLTLDLVVAIGMLRLRRLRKSWLVGCASVVEALTIVVWIQVTGTVTTYFLLVAILFILWYRLSFGFAVSATITVALVALHAGAVALELFGVLDAKPLFLAPPGPEYTEPFYQSVLCGTILSMYGLAFVAANHFVNKQREHDRVLAEVRSEANQAVERAQHGRLTGHMLADEYAVGELLGRGGMGEVYVAERVSDGTRVALKVLHGHLMADEHMLARFQREAAAIERVPHAHTARILDVGHDAVNALDFIAMEYLRGEDLAAFLRRRGTPDPIGQAPLLLRRIATALDAAHGAGVVHRDLKPQNIFLVETGRASDWPQVRLLDFGMSKVIDSVDETLTRAGALIGTIAYMSPEQALGDIAKIGPASDRFALAAIAYRVLTGRLPFDTQDMMQAIHHIAYAHPPLPSSLNTDLHPDVDAVLAVGLAKAPRDRYESATAMVDNLDAALQGTLDDSARDRARALAGNSADVDPAGPTATTQA